MGHNGAYLGFLAHLALDLKLDFKLTLNYIKLTIWAYFGLGIRQDLHKLLKGMTFFEDFPAILLAKYFNI